MFMYSELQKPGSSFGTGYGLDDSYSPQKLLSNGKQELLVVHVDRVR
jgi:hypothetical protein